MVGKEFTLMALLFARSRTSLIFLLIKYLFYSLHYFKAKPTLSHQFIVTRKLLGGFGVSGSGSDDPPPPIPLLKWS